MRKIVPLKRGLLRTLTLLEYFELSQYIVGKFLQIYNFTCHHKFWNPQGRNPEELASLTDLS